MKTHKKLFSLLLSLCMLSSLSITALAASYSGDDVKPGLSVQPGDELTHPENTGWANLTASWGVRVIFVDWDESELKSEVVPVTDNTPGRSSAPSDPTRTGYTFTGWERHDTGSGTAALNGDGTVTGVKGPGPIVFIAKYTSAPVPDPEKGNLTVKKVLAGNAADSSKAFDFTVTLGDASVSGVYGDMSFAGGKAVFSLKGGESRTAAGLPAGISYTVTEADYTAEGYKTTASGDAGTIEDGKTVSAVFTNTKNDSPTPPPGPTPSPSPTPVPDTGNLSVMKVVSGNAAETDRAFGFTVTLTDTAVNGTYGEMSFTGGTAAFSLKGGESRTATGLPSGTGYTVTEEDCSADGYVTEISGGSGTVTHGKTSAAVFTNTRNALEAVPEAPAPFMGVLGAVSEDPTTPDTGDGSGLMFWVLLLAASAAVLTGTAVYGFKKRNIN